MAFMTKERRCMKKCRSALGSKPARLFARGSASVLAAALGTAVVAGLTDALTAWQNRCSTTAGSWGLETAVCCWDVRIVSSTCAVGHFEQIPKD